MDTLGLYSTSELRDRLGVGSVNKCSNAYIGGKFAGSTLPAWGRLAYIARVGTLGAGVTTLDGALAASAERNALKSYFRGPLAKLFSDYKTSAQVLGRYGDDVSAIASAASRTNPYFNSLAGTAIYAASLRAGFSAADCSCGK